MVSKVIIEAAYLTDEEKVTATHHREAAGADFVKTSTGFGPGGATAADVALLRRVVGAGMGVKAAGGVRDFAALDAMVRAGDAHRRVGRHPDRAAGARGATAAAPRRPATEPDRWPQPTDRDRLGELARLFLWLGIVGFGGPAAHLALMEEQVVRRRGSADAVGFVDLVGLTNLIPGPNSTEMALAVGYRRAGLPGLLTSGISFIVPAAAMTTALAWAYRPLWRASCVS